MKDDFVRDRNGRRKFKEGCFAINDGPNKDGSARISKSWHVLKEKQESYPVQVSGFAVACLGNQSPRCLRLYGELV